MDRDEALDEGTGLAVRGAAIANAAAEPVGIDGRISREAAFHDQRFTEEVRTAQAKYYFALTDCEARYKAFIHHHAKDARLLEFGCAKGDFCLEYGAEAAQVCGIDISPVAIDQANAKARSLAITNADFSVRDCMATGYAAESFDLVFGSGIIHHLDTERAIAEVHRILGHGGSAIFLEPLQGNAFFRLYRKLTPRARSEDEHPLEPKDIEIVKSIFPDCDVSHHGLLALLSVPFRNARFGKGLRAALMRADQLLFRFPPLRWSAWYVTIQVSKP